MSKRFRTCDLNQPFLLPPSLQQWLPENHLARFVADVADELDLSEILAVYGRKDGRGKAAYHPLMMVRLLLYGYCRGVVSSRKIERATFEDLAFRYLAADQHPDHDSIANFRQTHLQSLAGLFIQALQMCDKAGLVKLGHVAIDGTKLKANASKHKAMSYDRMVEKEKQLQEEVKNLLAQAAQTDAGEDIKYGKGKRGDELPEELARRESRLKKIAEAAHEPVYLPPSPTRLSVAEVIRPPFRLPVQPSHQLRNGRVALTYIRHRPQLFRSRATAFADGGTFRYVFDRPRRSPGALTPGRVRRAQDCLTVAKVVRLVASPRRSG